LSINNNIRNLLDIQDKNIIFQDNCVTYEELKGKKCKFIEGTLTTIPTKCLKCHAPNESSTIYKNGTQTSKITLPMCGIYPTYLLLRKQRYVCKSCHQSFTLPTELVKKNCFISNQVRSLISVKLTHAQSIKSIAQDTFVSETTVQRIINKLVSMQLPYDMQLPAHLSFDEFKYAKGHMAFQYIDAETGKILGILDDRYNSTIINHFSGHYSRTTRNKVKTVTIDMNAGYVSVIKELFPNAKIIIDRFHLVQLISRSMNKYRIQMMNQLKKSSNDNMKKYRRLKQCWKLLLKNRKDISSVIYNYYRLFGQRTEEGILDEVLSYSPLLKENYEYYQSLLSAIQTRNITLFQSILEKDISPNISNYMKTSIKTLKKHLPYIENSFIYPYNNGRIEGINNKIKVLNRIAYGYRNFNHYRKRIIIHFLLKPISTMIS